MFGKVLPNIVDVVENGPNFKVLEYFYSLSKAIINDTLITKHFINPKLNL